MTILERSKQASENGEIWTAADHAALESHLAKINQTIAAMVEAAERRGRRANMVIRNVGSALESLRQAANLEQKR